MASSFPPDVVVVDSELLLHARFTGGRKNPQITRVGSHRVAPETFSPSVVTPALANAPALSESIRRLKVESGNIDRVSLLLPDSWFRIHLNEVSELPEGGEEANEVVRWTLRRSLPMRPEELRIAYQALARTNGSVKVLILAAMEKTLREIEEAFRSNGIEVSLIEPVGLNIWNAVSVREPATTGDRLFFYVRRTDFTTAVFRGTAPLFIRSRNLSGERTLLQEIRLSASYLRNNLQWQQIEQCFIASNSADQQFLDAISQEFSTTVRRVSLRDFAVWEPSVDIRNYEAELTACAGVFTA